MKVDWNDQASRFAYSDWLEEQGRLAEANQVRGGPPAPVEFPADLETLGQYSGDGRSRGTHYGSGDREGFGAGEVGANYGEEPNTGCGDSFLYRYGSGDGEGMGEGYYCDSSWKLG